MDLSKSIRDQLLSTDGIFVIRSDKEDEFMDDFVDENKQASEDNNNNNNAEEEEQFDVENVS